MLELPSAAEPLLNRCRVGFTRPTFERFVLLSVGAIVTFGRRSVSRILWTLGSAARGNSSSYHRLFCKARWSLWMLARALSSAVLELVPSGHPVLLGVDDHLIQHGGRRVYGRGRHRSSVGSTKGMLCWGHRWVILAVIVRLPFVSRDWALPVLCALYRDRKTSEQEKRRHKTLLPVRWVYTHDPQQPDDHDWFFCTEPTMTPASIVQHFARRWAIEVTFQELHVHLGLHTTRQRCRPSILRTVPWLLGVFSGVCLVFNKLPRLQQKVLHHTPCYDKSEVTFADALYAVRRSLWECCLLKKAIGTAIVTKLPNATQRKLITYLAEAA